MKDIGDGMCNMISNQVNKCIHAITIHEYDAVCYLKSLPPKKNQNYDEFPHIKLNILLLCL